MCRRCIICICICNKDILDLTHKRRKILINCALLEIPTLRLSPWNRLLFQVTHNPEGIEKSVSVLI